MEIVSVGGEIKIGIRDPVMMICRLDQNGKHHFTFTCGRKKFVNSFNISEQWQREKNHVAVCKKFDADETNESVIEVLDSSVINAAEHLAKKIAEQGCVSESNRGELVIVNLADVEAEPVSWFWRNRIPRGKITILAGIPGLGKTFTALDCAARASVGGLYPDCDDRAPIGATLFFGCEDGLSDTVRPRFDAAGGDATKFDAITAVKYRDPDTGEEFDRTPDLTQDLDLIEAHIVRRGDVVLMIIDPLPPFLGAVDSHKDKEVRRALSRLAALAEKYSIAILGISHLTKDETRAAINRTQGSIAFVAAARSVLAVIADRHDTTGRRRLLLSVKSNLADNKSGLAFELTPRYTNGIPCIVWEAEPVTTSADEAMAPEQQKRGPEAEQRDEAAEFLRQALANGPRLSKEVDEEALETQGIKPSTLKRARKAIGVEAFRQAVPGPWWLRLAKGTTHARHETLGPLDPLETVQEGQEDQEGQVVQVSNGHDPDAINHMFAEVGEDEA